MASNNLIITIFLIFCFFILETFEKTEISKRILELRKLQNSEEEEEENTNSPSTTSSPTAEGTYSSDSKNSTEYEPPIDRSKASRTIMGFGKYEKDGYLKKITFIVYVKKTKNEERYKFLYFTIVFKYKKLRFLEASDYPINIGAELNETAGNDYYDIYNVDTSKKVENLDIDEINSMTIKNDFCFSSNTDECDEYDKINKINTYFNIDELDFKNKDNFATNLDKYIDNQVFYFEVLNLTSQSYVYDLYGNITSLGGNNNIEIKKSNIDIYYSQYSSNNNKYMDILTGNIEKSPNSEYQYKIRFYIERSINTNLDGARIDASNIISTRLRNLDSSNEKYLFLSETEEGQLYIKQDYEPSGPKYYTRKGGSDSGLSGGAIAGIIIASIVVLIAVAFVFIYLNKRPKLPISHSSAIEFYNSASSMQN